MITKADTTIEKRVRKFCLSKEDLVAPKIEELLENLKDVFVLQQPTHITVGTDYIITIQNPLSQYIGICEDYFTISLINAKKNSVISKVDISGSVLFLNTLLEIVKDMLVHTIRGDE